MITYFNFGGGESKTYFILGEMGVKKSSSVCPPHFFFIALMTKRNVFVSHTCQSNKTVTS